MKKDDKELSIEKKQELERREIRRKKLAGEKKKKKKELDKLDIVPIQKSACCEAEIVFAGEGSEKIMVCRKCKSVCDLFIEKEKKEEQERTTKKKKEFLEKFELSKAMIGDSCAAVGIARALYYVWIKTDEEFKKKVEEIKDQMNEFSEEGLFKHIKKWNLKAICFYLRFKHSDYRQKNENFNRDVPFLEDQLKEYYERQKNRSGGAEKQPGNNGGVLPDSGQAGKEDQVSGKSGSALLLAEKDKAKPDSKSEKKGANDNN